MRIWIPLLVLFGMTLAGCTNGTDGKTDDGLEVDDQTGGLRGIVVDMAITPVAAAVISLNTGENMTTGADGAFSFVDLKPGNYLVQVGKPGYRAASATTEVEAGVPNPTVIKLQIERIADATPFPETYRLDGFYECAFALFFITDGCDFGYRSAYDELPTQPSGVPRTVQKFTNTQFILVPAEAFTIVQEAWWDQSQTGTFWIMIDKTPISNDCDCSDTYSNVVGSEPLLNRLDRYTPNGTINEEFRNDMEWSDTIGVFPTDVSVASRGFVPPPDDPTGVNYAVNMRFIVLTTVFHNYRAPDGWTFETQSQHPIG